jgi:hypothetical protein
MVCGSSHHDGVRGRTAYHRSLKLRIDQYGLTIARIEVLACLLVAACYAFGYAWARCGDISCLILHARTFFSKHSLLTPRERRMLRKCWIAPTRYDNGRSIVNIPGYLRAAPKQATFHRHYCGNDICCLSGTHAISYCKCMRKSPLNTSQRAER